MKQNRTNPPDPVRDLPETGFWGRRAGVVAGALLALLLVQGLVFIGEASQTSDEAAHLAAGYSYLTTCDFRLNPEHPPLMKEVAALPLLLLDLDFHWGPLWDHAEEWNIGRLFVHENRSSNETLLFLGRLPILLLSIVLGYALFRWARRLFGVRAALVALALYVLDPNVVAHSSLITTDLGVMLFMFLAVYALWVWSERPTPRALVLLALAVGGAFASKYTALWLLPILGVLGMILLALGEPIPQRHWSRRSPMAPGSRFGLRRITALGLAGVLVAAIALVILAMTYGGVGLPAYMVGLDRGLRHTAGGHMGYLMGEYSETGWWYYFLFAYLVKTPPGTLLIIALSAMALLFGHRRLRAKDELFIHVPIILTLLITSIWKVNIGLRHLLPIYPLLYISAGRILAVALPGRSSAWTARLLPVLALVGLGWNMVEAYSIAPHHLAYFNRFAGGPENGHRLLLDSNLDWGQSSNTLRRYMEKEGVPAIYCAFSGNSDPWYYGVRYQYVPGSGNLMNPKLRRHLVPRETPRELLAVSGMVLHSVHLTDQNLYAWLRDREPVATPGYNFRVYDITGDAESHSYIAVVYVNFGMLDLAGIQARRALEIDPDNALAHAVLQAIRDEAEKGGIGG